MKQFSRAESKKEQFKFTNTCGLHNHNYLTNSRRTGKPVPLSFPIMFDDLVYASTNLSSRDLGLYLRIKSET